LRIASQGRSIVGAGSEKRAGLAVDGQLVAADDDSVDEEAEIR
jgi:hypothetical protein